jgi:hypothetical protein
MAATPVLTMWIDEEPTRGWTWVLTGPNGATLAMAVRYYAVKSNAVRAARNFAKAYLKGRVALVRG